MRALDRVAVATLVAVLTWLMFMGFSAVDERLQNALHGVDSYAASESALHRDVLSAHAGLLNNYDPLDDDITGMQHALRLIGEHRESLVEQREGAVLVASFERQQALAERFKTGNALVQNSLAYFATYSGLVAARVGRTQARGAVDRLSSAMLQLSLNGSRATQDDVEAAIDGLGRSCRQVACGREARGLLAHGRLLKRLLPGLAATIEELVRSGSEAPVRALRLELLDQQQAAEAAAGHFRVLLYLASLLLVYLLVRWGLAVRTHAAALRRQLVLEHAVSRLSTQLIATVPERLELVIADALADIGTTLGASQAQFVDGRTGRTFAWPGSAASLPTCWVERLSRMSAPFGEQGHGVVHLVRSALPAGSAERAAFGAAGIESSYCILPPGEGGSANLLAFGFARSRADWQLPQFAVLTTALDAISLSLDHAYLTKERSQLAVQLEHARRMETVGAFASGIAHNFNNLLGAIAGHVEMAAEAADGDSRWRGHVDKIGMSAERGRQLVSGLLRYGRRHDSQRETVDLDALVLESCGLAQAGLTATHCIDFQPGAPGAVVQADAVQLQQVIMNLCNNAAQAMPGGGVIEVRTLADADHAVLTIADTGGGIAPDQLAKVFEPFFTTRPSGTGLGLSTARDIVVDQGGTMILDSMVDAGTTVTISLPCSTPERTGFHGNGETVLYLAQNRGDWFSGEELLAALGYEPVGFADPVKCLAALEAAPQRFEAVIVADAEFTADARLLLARARVLRPTAPRILAGHHYRNRDAASLADAGVSSLVQLPLEPRELAGVLRRAFELEVQS